MSACTVTGGLFSPRHQQFLDQIAATRNARMNCWISKSLSKVLQLTPRCGTVPIVIGALNEEKFFYLVEDFVESAEVILQRSRAHFEALERRTSEAGKGEGTPNPPCTGSCDLAHPAPNGIPRPLRTNGSFLDNQAECDILTRFPHLQQQSPYWVTAAEASYIFQSPVRCTPPLAAPSVKVPHPCGFLMTYYHVSSTVDPKVYTEENCSPYNPINFHGEPYAPMTAALMKRYAVQHRCCRFSRWITLTRLARLGAVSLPHVRPLVIMVNGEITQLINTGLTRDPFMLEAYAKGVEVKCLGA